MLEKMFYGGNIVIAAKVVSQVLLGSEIPGWPAGGNLDFDVLMLFVVVATYLRN